MCIYDVLWLREKTKQNTKIAQYSVHNEMLLCGTDKQSGHEKISVEYCIFLGIAALEKVWTNREKLKGDNLIQVCLTSNFEN